MPAILDGPIPGESLTKTPGNAPWEQPPQFADAQQALARHLSKFDDEEIVDDLLFVLAQGFPVNIFVETLLTGAVMEGIHTLDVSILIGPVIHEYIMALAEAAGIDAVEEDGPSKEDKMKAKEKERFLIMLNQALAESGGDSELIENASKQLGEEAVEGVVSEAAPPEKSEGLPLTNDKPKGFVSRRKV